MAACLQSTRRALRSHSATSSPRAQRLASKEPAFLRAFLKEKEVRQLSNEAERTRRERDMTQSAAITFPKADSQTSKEAVWPHSVVVPDRDLHAALVQVCGGNSFKSENGVP